MRKLLRKKAAGDQATIASRPRAGESGTVVEESGNSVFIKLADGETVEVWKHELKGFPTDRTTFDVDSDGKVWAVNSNTGERVGPYDSYDDARAAAKEKSVEQKFGLSYSPGTRVEYAAPGNTLMIATVVAPSLLGLSYKIRLDDGTIVEDASAKLLSPSLKSWDRGYNDGVDGRARSVDGRLVELRKGFDLFSQQRLDVKRKFSHGSVSKSEMAETDRRYNALQKSVADANAKQSEYDVGYEQGANWRVCEMRRLKASGAA